VCFSRLNKTANGIIREEKHILIPRSLLSKWRTVSWYGLEGNFTYVYKKSSAFLIPVFMKFTDAQQRYMHVSWKELRPSPINVETTITSSIIISRF